MESTEAASGAGPLQQSAEGRKNDYKDAKRLARRLLAGELMLSFVPGAEQRTWRELARAKEQYVRERVSVQNRMEGHLEEMRIKLSGVIGEVPGFGVDSAQRLIAEIGVDAEAFRSADEFASWFGGCPGSNVSAEENQSSRSPKGNEYVRKLLTQAAQAAVKKKGSVFQQLFRRFLPRLTYNGAIRAIAHRLGRLAWIILPQGVHYIEKGAETTPQARKRRRQKLTQALRKPGYAVTLIPPNPGSQPVLEG
jgi:transposase